MTRRRFLAAIATAFLAGAGCLETDRQPEQVPVWIENQTERRQRGSVTWTVDPTGEVLLSTTFDLAPGDEESFYAEPIRPDGDYVVGIEIAGERTEQPVSGGRLRSVDAAIDSGGRVRIEPANA